MQLDRDINKDGKGKYALVRLRNIQPGDEAFDCLKKLEKLGYLDWGVVGQPDEFFVIKLRDKFSDAALCAYAEAVHRDYGKAREAQDEEKAASLLQYATAVMAMAARAGIKSLFCKEPD